MSKKRLPEKPFKVKFKIARFGFTDFHFFVQRFVTAANWKIVDVNESTQTYYFENGWGMTLFAHGDINLSSPILPREKASEVYDIIDILLKLEVRLGENCEVTSHYVDSEPSAATGVIQAIPVEYFCASALILFVINNAFQLFYRNNMPLPLMITFQLGSFIFAAIFGFSFYRIYNRNRDAFQESLVEAGIEKAHEEFMSDKDTRKKIKHPNVLQPIDLVEEMRLPLENILAYTRFYKSHTRPDSQHWKDLMEIGEQTARIREVMNRVESSFQSTFPVDSSLPAHEESHLFRKSSRILDLLPVTIRGTDLMGESFENSCYTLNISATGACLLLPEHSVAIGRPVELLFDKFKTISVVRWVMQGKSGGMMFAGIEFAESIDLNLVRFPSENHSPPSSSLSR
jgi:hypothetical protein